MSRSCVLNVVFFLRDPKCGHLSYSWLCVNVFIIFFWVVGLGFADRSKKNGKFRITGNGNSVFLIVPPEYAVPYLFPFPYKYFLFRFRFTKFHFSFHISLPFVFFRGKVEKIPLRFHP